MRPRRSVKSDRPLILPGGTEDNDLWIEIKGDGNDNPVLASVWQPSAEERERIANGENIELQVWGAKHPPVNVVLTDIELKGVDRETDTPDAPDYNDWPTADQVLEALVAARIRDTDGGTTPGYRTMAELAGSLQCPDFSHLLPALDALEAEGKIVKRPSTFLNPDLPSLYRVSSQLMQSLSEESGKG